MDVNLNWNIYITLFLEAEPGASNDDVVVIVTVPQESQDENEVSLPYKQRAFIIYDNDVTLSLT